MTRIMIAVLFALVAGCGGTKTGNPPGNPVIGSAAFNLSGSARIADWARADTAMLPGDGFGTALSNVTTLKICVKEVKIDLDNGSNSNQGCVAGTNPGSIKFSPGLIDLSSGAAKDWGTACVPAGVNVQRIRIRVDKDKDSCGTDNLSIQFNGVTSSDSVEMKWVFSPALPVTASLARVSLSMSTLVSALRQADDGTLDTGKLDSAAQSSEGQAKGQ